MYKETLLHAIVEFSQQRIYSRLKCPQWQNAPSDCFSPLHIRINEVLARPFHISGENAAKFAKLKKELSCVSSALKGVDHAPEKKQLGKLKEVVKQCYDISNHTTSNSLEKHLKLLGTPEYIYQSSEVRQIDKLGKYWGVCRDLLRHGRQERTRHLFTNFQLEVLEAPPPRKPASSNQSCNVHGEVQLVLFYENYPMAFPPRAIGSSKSACLLCDQFIKLHGKFGISHSHKRLYTHWTIPNSSWMDPRQRTIFQEIVENMSVVLKRWSKRGGYVINSWADSKANVWEKREESSTDSSVVSGNIEEAALPIPPSTLKRNSSSSSSSTIRAFKQKEEDTSSKSEETIPEPYSLISANDSLERQQFSVSQLVEEGSRIEFEEMAGTKTPTQGSPGIPSNISDEHVEEAEEVVGKVGEERKTGREKIALTRSSPIQQPRPPSKQEEYPKPSPEIATCSLMQNNPIQQPSRDSGTEHQENAPTPTIPLLLPEQQHEYDSHQDQAFKVELQEKIPILMRKRSTESLFLPAKELRNNSKQDEDVKTDAEETLLSAAIMKQMQFSLVQQSNPDSSSKPQQKVPSRTPSITTPSIEEQQLNGARQQERDSKIERISTTSPPHLAHKPNSSRKEEEEPEIQLEETRPPPRIPAPTSPPQSPQLLEQYFTCRDLPLSFPIHPSTKSFTLSNKPVGHKKVRYTFDLEAVSHGKVELFESRHSGRENCINIKKMRGGDEVDVRPIKGEEKLEFDMCFGRRNLERLGVVITWHEGIHRKEKLKDNFWTRLPSSLSSWWHGGTMPRSRR